MSSSPVGTPGGWTSRRWLDAFHAEAAAFAAAVHRQPPSDPVPSCAGWTVDDLVAHVGGVYRWHRQHLERRSTEPPDHARPVVPVGVETVDWWRAEQSAMGAALEAAGPDDPAWNWSIQPRRAAFWHRRMAHETAVHRWDAQRAAGRAEAIPTALAVDGIAEVLDTFLPSGRTAGPQNLHGTVVLAAVDSASVWRVSVHGPTVTLDRSGSTADCRVSGTAHDLLLTLWGRVGPTPALDIAGDGALLAALHAR